MRLIDADALMDLFREYMNANYNKEKCISAEDCENCNGCLWKKVVDKAPTIDAEPIVHSSWRFNKDGSGTCGNCRRTTKNVWDYDSHMRYCPNCGAKMDGEQEVRT